MYNLLMKFSGHFNEWEENQGRLYDVSFFAGRIFEHTAPTIQRQFTAVGGPDFEVLMKLPCLFNYEGYNVVGSIGRISDVRSDRGNYQIAYILPNDYPNYPTTTPKSR